jgi:glycosyltransferase involved in cell wall biosynthesis
MQEAMLVMSTEAVHAAPRTLAGATILQIVPALGHDAVALTAFNTAYALLQAGARAIIAGETGALVEPLTSVGAEWIPLATATINPLKLRRNAGRIEQLVISEHIDLVHAHSAGAAWSVVTAAVRAPVLLVTSLPDVPAVGARLRTYFSRALARGDRIIAPSSYAARPVMEQFAIPAERMAVIPRSIDTDLYDPDAVEPDRVSALRKAWGIEASNQVVLVPGRVAPWNGQDVVVEAAHALLESGWQDVRFVLTGEDRSHRRYAGSVVKRAKELGVENLVRLVGHCRDMPAAYAAANIVAIPALEPPLIGRAVAEAQAMGRPVITTNVGVMAENVAVPPLVPDELRTGWVVNAGDAIELANAVADALSLDGADYRRVAARARQFAEYMFSPESVAAATCEVYTSLLSRDT